MKASHRHQARHYAVQALYQWHVSGNDLVDIEQHFLEDFNFKKTDAAYFHELLYGVAQHVTTLDEHLKPLLDRKINALGPVELAILRMSSYELVYRLDVPYKVVINEGVNLTKTFGAADAHKYINGVLDKLAREIRKLEI